MRVTQQMLSANTMRYVNLGYQRLGGLQDQLTTGKRITRVSQDPVIAMKGLQHRQALSDASQFKRNINEAQNWLDHSEGILDQTGQNLKRISELIVQASNDTYDADQRKSVAKEIAQLSEYLQDLSNSKVDNRYLFNGANTDNPPFKNGAVVEPGIAPILETGADLSDYTIVYNGESFRYMPDEAGMVFQHVSQVDQENLPIDQRIVLRFDSADENVSVTYTNPITGSVDLEVDPNELSTVENTAISTNTQDVYIEVNKGVKIPVNVKGSHVFSASLFGDLARLEKALSDPEITGEELSEFITIVDKHHTNVVAEQSEVGVRLNRIEMMVSRLDDQHASLQKMMTENEDVDIEETIMNLVLAENVHRVALSVGARIMQPSLLDFLR
ncbi:flagellar hook-associated protein FlgL [Alkalicoccobacillus porphyridii]|uniref:Flagellar hook-associated protein 3 n=1 Tax=Alkalicoccobacillus porphyridii TaxID=2597270 RepID=A0A554A3S6_9BACI|nr:flagellar hook-associated protein FlgL [Alkalicoccobacillus porphyridii]TSB48340.1 flagellar hook-associated protein 3 [Alkalicoccobacillus porphyridii]